MSHTYFISYAVPSRNGFGNSIVTMDYSLSSAEQIMATVKFLEKENDLDGIVILFFHELVV